MKMLDKFSIYLMIVKMVLLSMRVATRGTAPEGCFARWPLLIACSHWEHGAPLSSVVIVLRVVRSKQKHARKTQITQSVTEVPAASRKFNSAGRRCVIYKIRSAAGSSTCFQPFSVYVGMFSYTSCFNLLNNTFSAVAVDVLL